MKIFGFEIKREEDEAENAVSFTAPSNDDGAITVESSALGGFYSTILDMEGTAKTESELITKYRGLAMQPEIAQAVDEIVNEILPDMLMPECYAVTGISPDTQHRIRRTDILSC